MTVSYNKQEILTLCEHLCSPPRFFGVCVAHLFTFLCWVMFFVLFVFVLCLVYPILPVSLHCSFLITPLVFSNVYYGKGSVQPCHHYDERFYGSFFIYLCNYGLLPPLLCTEYSFIWSSLSVTCSRSVFFSRFSRFLLLRNYI
jgi:hypothetical protein